MDYSKITSKSVGPSSDGEFDIFYEDTLIGKIWPFHDGYTFNGYSICGKTRSEAVNRMVGMWIRDNEDYE